MLQERFRELAKGAAQFVWGLHRFGAYERLLGPYRRVLDHKLKSAAFA